MLGILRHDHSQAKFMLLLLFRDRPRRTYPAASSTVRSAPPSHRLSNQVVGQYKRQSAPTALDLEKKGQLSFLSLLLVSSWATAPASRQPLLIRNLSA
jgi:hypothetical protein